MAIATETDTVVRRRGLMLRRNREPINILKEHEYELKYKGLESTLELADKQRDGIFGTAEKRIQCLTRKGPFYNCDMKEHRDPDHLEPKKAPDGWFRDAWGQLS